MCYFYSCDSLPVSPMATFRGVSLYDWASHFIPIVRWLPSYKVRSRAGHPARL